MEFLCFPYGFPIGSSHLRRFRRRGRPSKGRPVQRVFGNRQMGVSEYSDVEFAPPTFHLRRFRLRVALSEVKIMIFYMFSYGFPMFSLWISYWIFSSAPFSPLGEACKREPYSADIRKPSDVK